MRLSEFTRSVVVEEIKEVDLRSCNAQFINWATCGEPSSRNEFNNFFLWGREGGGEIPGSLSRGAPSASSNLSTISEQYLYG